MHRATVRFWSLFERLPASAQKAARKNFELLKTDPAYPSLHFKKVGNPVLREDRLQLSRSGDGG